jgi:hypothetical protein
MLSAETVDKIIVKVGREIILQSDLDKRLQQLQAAGMLNQEITTLDILNDMIESELILQKAKQEEYEVDEDNIRNMAGEQIKQIASHRSERILYRDDYRTEPEGIDSPE